MRNKWISRILGAAALIFGVMTLKAGGSVLFGPEAYRIEAGNYVPFVLTFNFFAGFFYIAAGIGILIDKTWAPGIAGVIAATTVIVFIVLGVHIQTGGLYETKTIIAMLVRTIFWVFVFAITWRSMKTERGSGLNSVSAEQKHQQQPMK